MRTLVLGGIRSGKSGWAELAFAEALRPGQQARYIATGVAPDGDQAWSARVGLHRERRPKHWTTVESADVATQLRCDTATPTLVDDIGGWLTAAMDTRKAWPRDPSVCPDLDADVDELLSAAASFGSLLVLVSPEVGLTVVPATEAGRKFADQLGLVNQKLATLCDRVVLVVAGQVLPIKGERR
ncbi:MAG: bifunctional adenosylcobinamide kinase/adenosylcobinamide-phosphate guanylyltransferase [Mycobacterium sp.]